MSALPSTDAGIPVGDCPDCSATLVRARDRVSCPDCGWQYSLPAGATVLNSSCSDCGLSLFQVERGDTFELCLDYECESLDERVRESFDRLWDCPDCDGLLRVLRRGGLLLACDQYPDCETAFSFPDGSHPGACACGLPRFEMASGVRCLDSNCTQATCSG